MPRFASLLQARHILPGHFHRLLRLIVTIPETRIDGWSVVSGPDLAGAGSGLARTSGVNSADFVEAPYKGVIRLRVGQRSLQEQSCANSWV